MNRIALLGPHSLRECDKREIFPFLQDILPESHISILAYRSFELDIIRHFLTLEDDMARHLSVYLVHSLESLQQEHYPLAQSILYLSSIGAHVHEFHSPHAVLTRQPYLALWETILKDQDEMLSFYNGSPDEQTKLLAPLSVAQAMNKNAYLFRLSGEDPSQPALSAKEKITLLSTN